VLQNQYKQGKNECQEHRLLKFIKDDKASLPKTLDEATYTTKKPKFIILDKCHMIVSTHYKVALRRRPCNFDPQIPFGSHFIDQTDRHPKVIHLEYSNHTVVIMEI